MLASATKQNLWAISARNGSAQSYYEWGGAVSNLTNGYIGNVENGFYIEAGAYDGEIQSNTKFLEEEYDNFKLD